MLSLPKLPQVWSSYFVDQVFGPLSKGVRGVQALDTCCCASTAELTLATHTPTLHKQFSMLFLFLVFYLQSLTLCDCSPAPSLHFFTSSLPTANKRIPLINVLAASLSVPVEPILYGHVNWIIPSSSVLSFYDHKLLSFILPSFYFTFNLMPPKKGSTWLSILTWEPRSEPHAKE